MHVWKRISFYHLLVSELWHTQPSQIVTLFLSKVIPLFHPLQYIFQKIRLVSGTKCAWSFPYCIASSFLLFPLRCIIIIGRRQQDANTINIIHVASKRMPRAGKSNTIAIGIRHHQSIRIMPPVLWELFGTSFIPHLGQLPGASLTTSGCIGQV